MLNLRGKRILVAGGTGFIGKHLVPRLVSEGAEVFVITRKEKKNREHIIYLKGDLNSIDSLYNLSQEAFDACVYMAANIPEIGQPKESYYDAKKSTLDPLVNFCEVFIKHVSKFVYISTIDVLGGASRLNYDENEPIQIATPYGLAKYCGEFYVRDYCHTNSVFCTILRFSQVYGPNEPIVRVIPIIRNAVVNGKKFTIYSDGSELRRFLYVEDAATSIICALKSKEGGLYNIAGLETCSLIDLVSQIEKAYNRKLDLEILNNGVGHSNVPSIKLAEEKLNYQPSYSIEEGIKCILKEEAINGKI